ncbi:S-adenosyl-L-methionine-dependent methyltransferase [Kalaharituber pfeilii]|nr:S-adenosyl-L-methionine-dependent methyltransferase [Kalaharituber pfeilii]
MASHGEDTDGLPRDTSHGHQYLSPEGTETPRLLEVEREENSEDTDDLDSSIGTEFPSGTTSLLSNIFNYKYENGRRYHAFRDGKYTLPNDEEEQDRLDLYHHVWSMMLGGELYIAPIERPQRALDIGTGTGIWAIDFADRHPECQIIGNDLSPVQPEWVPPNVKFEIDDAEMPWAFSKREKFDFIHLRNMAGSFQNWDEVIRQCFIHAKPGGFVEVHDFDYILLNGPLDNPRPIDPKSPLKRWWHLTVAAGDTAGRPFVSGSSFLTRLEAAGFQHVTGRWEYWPFAAWHKQKNVRERGMYAQLGLKEGLIPYSIALLTRFSGWSKDDVDQLCKDAAAELMASPPKEQYWCKAWFVYGQKPFDATDLQEGAAMA